MSANRSQVALQEIKQILELEPANNLQAAYLAELASWGLGEDIPRPNWWTFRRYETVSLEDEDPGIYDDDFDEAMRLQNELP